PSIKTKVSLGSKPRRLNWTLPSPPLTMFRFTVQPAFCGMYSCRSVALRIPNFSMSCGRYVSTGFGPVSSAVGIFEPVTTTRSTSAEGAGAPGSAGTAGAGSCAKALDVRMNGNPTLATRASRTNLNVFSAFLVISFSIGLVRFRQGYSISKALTSFFFTFFEVFLNGQTGLFVARSSGLAEEVNGWQAFFSVFLKFFLGHAHRDFGSG